MSRVLLRNWRMEHYYCLRCDRFARVTFLIVAYIRTHAHNNTSHDFARVLFSRLSGYTSVSTTDDGGNGDGGGGGSGSGDDNGGDFCCWSAASFSLHARLVETSLVILAVYVF